MRTRYLIGIPLLACVSPAPARAQAARDSAAAAAVVAAFHVALAAGDSAATLQLLADDAVILEAGGLETRAEYRAHHLPADIRFAQAVPSHRSAVQIAIRGDVAWVVGTSHSSGTLQDRPVSSAGAELMVLTREPAGWRIRAIHWSSRRRAP